MRLLQNQGFKIVTARVYGLVGYTALIFSAIFAYQALVASGLPEAMVRRYERTYAQRNAQAHRVG